MLKETKGLDRYSFEHLFRELYPRLLRYCTQIVRNKEIAEDIVQEKFIQLWEKREELIIHSSYKSFLYASVKNKAIDYLRSKYVTSYASMENAAILEAPATASETLEYAEYSRIVTKAVESLPNQCFAVFSLKRYGDLSRKEIAEKLNISEKTVDNHLSVATKKIKAFLLKYGLMQLLVF